MRSLKEVRKHHRIIHEEIKKYIPHRKKKLFKFKYPKLALLVISIIFSYYFFSKPEISGYINYLGGLSYLGVFIAGVLLSFGFTAPLALGFFIVLNPQNLWLSVILGSLGSTLADLIIFKTIKFSFMDEFNELQKTAAIKRINKLVRSNKNILIKHYLLYIFAGIIIATPLPDEIGVSMIAGLTTIKSWKLASISFILHALFLLMILSAI